MAKTITLSKPTFNDSLATAVRMTFTLGGLQYDEQGDPLPDQTIANRLRCRVAARLVSSDGEVRDSDGHGLVKDAVIAGALTQAEGLALIATLKKLYDHYLSEYD